MRLDDFFITFAYFSIPLQILASVYNYPRLTSMQPKILVMSILFALFILCCGVGHLLRCMGATHTDMYKTMNTLTSIVSMSTSIYLLPLLPTLLFALDKAMHELAADSSESKNKLFNFMAFLCHEIRNPLFAITSFVEVLDDEDDVTLSASQANAVLSIRQSSSLMLRLVNDVLDLSKLDTGKLEMDEKQFDLHQLLHHVCILPRQQILAAKKSVEFFFDLDPNVPRVMYGDSIRILQILYNLLSNAAKFTTEGRIDFKVSTVDMRDAARFDLIDSKIWSQFDFGSHVSHMYDAETSTICRGAEQGVSLLQTKNTFDGGDYLKNYDKNQYDVQVLRIEVVDTGIGISSARIAQILEPYSHMNLFEYRKHGGTGLGLAILTRVTSILRGKMQIRSTMGVGSAFIIHLPILVPFRDQALNQGTPDKIVRDSLESAKSPRLDLFGGNLGLDNVVNEMSMLEQGLRKGNEYVQPISNIMIQRGIRNVTQPISTATPSSFESTLNGIGGKKKALSKFDFPPTSSVVLVVDDNDLNLKLLCRMLQHFNLEFDTACNGQEAVEKVLKSRNVTGNDLDPQYALIWMDLQMPVMDGYEAIQTLREKHQITNIPVIALTANALEYSREEALKAGATEFCTKPILRDALHAKCEQYLLKSSNDSETDLDEKFDP